MNFPENARLVLGSSSPSRKALLSQLGIPFECDSPDIDETPQSGESARKLVERLSREKGKAVQARHPDAWIIAGDQVASFEGDILGKPGTKDVARANWQRFSGKDLLFYSGCHLIAPNGDTRSDIIETKVTIRPLSEAAIEAYLERETPYFCAAGLKVETSGIRLIQRIESMDPSALIGLSLIRVCDFLAELNSPWSG